MPKIFLYQDTHDPNMYHFGIEWEGYGAHKAIYHAGAIHRDAVNDMVGIELMNEIDQFKPGELIPINLTITIKED